MQLGKSTLRGRLAFQLCSIIACALFIGAGAMWGMSAVSEDYGAAVRGYAELRDVFEIGLHVARCRTAITDEHAEPEVAAHEANMARGKMELFTGHVRDAARQSDSEWMTETRSSEAVVRARLEDLAAAVRAARLRRASPAHADAALASIANLTADVRRAVVNRQQSAARSRKIATAVVGGITVLAAAIAIITGVRLYRRIVRPLEQLTRGAQGFAAGRFDERISIPRDREFALLAINFNRMAGDLGVLYRDLEGQVATKSRELARAARLASMGYLAAGVAHEINNPLGIIAGFGERARLHFDRGRSTTPAAPEVRHAIDVICEEAFRCKTMIDRLLTLARADGATAVAPAACALGAIARKVISDVAALPVARGRKLLLEEGETELLIHADAAEIRQVLLNLVINALEALVTAPAGERVVRVALRASGDADLAQIIVRDDGSGMTSDTIDRAFEPFFSGTRGARRGTGLGLAIAQSIVHAHRGKIFAHSDGPGLGSTIVVELPLLQSKETIDDR